MIQMIPCCISTPWSKDERLDCHPLRYIDPRSVPMEVDTGAWCLVSITPETMYHKLWPERGLDKPTISFKGTHWSGGHPIEWWAPIGVVGIHWSGGHPLEWWAPIGVVCSTDVEVALEGQTATQPPMIVKGEGSHIVGHAVVP